MKKTLPALSRLLLMTMLVSCATAPKLPQWALSPPSPDGTYTYFTGSASAGDPATAIGDATDRLIAGIMQYIGVDVRVSTSATARASLDSYSADLRQTVETESNTRLTGFQVSQKHLAKESKTGLTTAYILARYETRELEKEKARIAALFKERVDAVAKPEAEGDAFAAEGRALDAVKKYIEAMAAASGAEVENASIKLERNANKARAQVAGIGFLIGDGKSLQGFLGKAYTEPIAVRVFREGAQGRKPLPGASLMIGYSRKTPSGQLGTKTASFISDTSGYAYLDLPAPDFVGRGKILVQLDLSASMELLDKVGPGFKPQMAALEDEIRTKYAELPYIVTSGASEIPMVLFIVDRDEKGEPTNLGATQSGLAETLVREGFSVRGLSLDPALLAGPPDRLVAQARAAAPEGTLRLAYGSAGIDWLRKESGMFLASASASITIVDLRSGATLYSADKSRQVLASDEAGARRSALRDLGAQSFGNDILASLP
ncbi:MAG: hypothetical protein AAGU26_01210 [bacterium]|nr:hypothetical protein [Spirochaetales bacterium]